MIRRSARAHSAAVFDGGRQVSAEGWRAAVGARLKTRDVLVKPDWADCPQVNLQEAFGILDVGPSATEQEAKQAYRDFAKVWHPDRFRDDARLQAKASERLRKGIEAHRVIQCSITTQLRSEATSSESSTEPKPKQEPEQHSFQVRAGSITHSRELGSLPMHSACWTYHDGG